MVLDIICIFGALGVIGSASPYVFFGETEDLEVEDLNVNGVNMNNMQ